MTRPPARTAILIGNGVYPQADGALAPLAAPAHDVAVLADLLADPEVCRFDAPLTLVDRDSRTIKKTLLRALKGARPQDLVLVYYAGHGKVDRSHLYLCAHDTEPETLAATTVSISDIRDYVSQSECKQVVLILDCCFSGAAADGFRTRSELSDRIENAASARGLYLLTSCANHETSVEHVGTGEGDVPYGLYTRMLADGILSGEADIYQDGRITPLELAKYLQARIPGQTPRVSLIDTEGEEPVLAWTSWAHNGGQRSRVRKRLVEWLAEDSIPEDVFDGAIELLGRMPQNTVERRRKRLLRMCAGDGWDGVFTRGWMALAAGPGDDATIYLERFVTEHAANGSLSEGLYLDAMRLLASPQHDEQQKRRMRLLTLFARSPEREVALMVEAWEALERREQARAGEVSYAPSALPILELPPVDEVRSFGTVAVPVDEGPAAAGPGSLAPVVEPEVIEPEPLPESVASEIGISFDVPPAAGVKEASEQAETDPDPAPSSDLDQLHVDKALSSGVAAWNSALRGAIAQERRQVEKLQAEAAARNEGDTVPGGSKGDHDESRESSVPLDVLWLDDRVPDASLAREMETWVVDDSEFVSAPPEEEAVGREAEPVNVDAAGTVWDPKPSGTGTIDGGAATNDGKTLQGQRAAASISPQAWIVGVLIVLMIAAIGWAQLRSPKQSPYPPLDSNYDFPAVEGVLERVRFYEGTYPPSPAPDAYRSRFHASTTRYVWYELLVTVPQQYRDQELDLDVVWYNPRGSAFWRDSLVVTPDGTWTIGQGYGSNTRFVWDPGVYAIEILHADKRIAMAGFEILEDGVPLEVPYVQGRVTDLRFYDNRQTTDAGFVSRTRFSRNAEIALASWLRVQYPAPAMDNLLRVEVVYSTWKGREVARSSGSVTAAAGTTAADVGLSPSLPKREWAPGTYRAEYFANGRRIAIGFFDVI